jgi:hypothetical protein
MIVLGLLACLFVLKAPSPPHRFDLVVGIMLHLRGMRIAHADGQQQVQKELLRRRYAESLASTQVQTNTNTSTNPIFTCLPVPPPQYRHWNRREMEHRGPGIIEMTSTSHSVTTVGDTSVKYPFPSYQGGDIGKKAPLGANGNETSFGTSRLGPSWNQCGIVQDLEGQH